MPLFAFKTAIGTSSELHIIPGICHHLIIKNDGNTNLHIRADGVASTTDPEIQPGETLSLRDFNEHVEIWLISATSANSTRVYAVYSQLGRLQ